MSRHELDLGRLQKGVDFKDPRASAGFEALVGLERRLPHYRSLGRMSYEAPTTSSQSSQKETVCKL